VQQDEATLQYYRETFSQQLVFNIATKAVSASQVGGQPNIVIVASALMLMTDVARIVQSVSLGKSGFAALIDSVTLEVLVYGDKSPDQLYKDSLATPRFTWLSELDPSLSLNAPTVSYTKNGELYDVSQYRLFYGKLSLLVYVKRSEFFVTYDALSSTVTSTTGNISGISVGICLGIAAIVCICAFFLAKWLTDPLLTMHKGCAKIRDEMTKDDRDYGELIEPVFRDGDEVHELVADFMDVVKKLDDVEKIKRAIPRFPLNPIHNQVTIQAAPPVRERLLLSHGGVSVVFTSSPRWFDLSTVFLFLFCAW
jgi:hypothetical protein